MHGLVTGHLDDAQREGLKLAEVAKSAREGFLRKDGSASGQNDAYMRINEPCRTKACKRT